MRHVALAIGLSKNCEKSRMKHNLCNSCLLRVLYNYRYSIDLIHNWLLMEKPSLVRGTNKDKPLCKSHSTNKMSIQRPISDMVRAFQWIVPQLSIMIIYNSTWAILIQQIRMILSGDNLIQKIQKKDPFTSLHKIKANRPHWAEFEILRNGAQNEIGFCLYLSISWVFPLNTEFRITSIYWTLTSSAKIYSFYIYFLCLTILLNKHVR